MRRRERWDLLQGAGVRLHTSVHVATETFTFLDRNANRDLALAWKDCIYAPGTVKILPCELRIWSSYGSIFDAPTCTSFSAVDATSVAIMKRTRIRMADTFDHDFAAVGFRLVT